MRAVALGLVSQTKRHCLTQSRGHRAWLLGWAAIAAFLCAPPPTPAATTATVKRTRTLEGLKETAGLATPRAFVKGDNIHLYYTNENRVMMFKAAWKKTRLEGSEYAYYRAELKLAPQPSPIPDYKSHWRETRVYDNAHWLALAREAAEKLAPREHGQGCYFQYANAEYVLYHDATGNIRTAELAQKPKDLRIVKRLNAQEFAGAVTRLLEAKAALARDHQDLLLFVEIHEKQVVRFMLFDLQHRRCILLTPPRIGEDPRGVPHPEMSMRMLGALLIESHGLAILKNPVSSATRLLNFSYQTVAGLLKVPLPISAPAPPVLTNAEPMDLDQWEKELDRLAPGSRDYGTVKWLINGERFFPAFEQRLAEARRSIHLHVCIFDNDDVAVEVADLLKRRSAEVKVQVLLDLMCTQASCMTPPDTPMPEGFVPPPSISAYLRRPGKVVVRPFLNTWFTADHTKVFLIDGRYAYVGGMNFGREYRYEWHDMMAEVEGPIVGQLERDFQLAWAHAGPLGDLAYLEKLLFSQRPETTGAKTNLPAIRRLYTRTGELKIRRATLTALRRARHHIYLENPYIYDTAVVASLVRARRRGVDVRVVMPNQNDVAGGESGNFVIANYLLRNGVRVFVYPGMTHVKALLADGWACFGSANFNLLSLRRNQEVNLATSDQEIAKQLREQLFEVDFAKSHELKEPITVDWTDQLAETILEQF